MIQQYINETDLTWIESSVKKGIFVVRNKCLQLFTMNYKAAENSALLQTCILRFQFHYFNIVSRELKWAGPLKKKKENTDQIPELRRWVWRHAIPDPLSLAINWWREMWRRRDMRKYKNLPRDTEPYWRCSDLDSPRPRPVIVDMSGKVEEPTNAWGIAL